MQRVSLVTYGDLEVVPEMEAALDQLKASYNQYLGLSDFYFSQDPKSLMSLAGREVTLKVKQSSLAEVENNLSYFISALWAIAVPLGFTPWNRYPTPTGDLNLDFKLHFFGPWYTIYEKICSEGRGESAWHSMQDASLVDVGRLEHSQVLEKFVQSQLHRWGYNCGLVDGVLGPRVQNCLKALNAPGLNLKDLAEYLKGESPADLKKHGARETVYGQVVIPNYNFKVFTYGKVYSAGQASGSAALTVEGPGRVILDVG
jgi:hypothetical protein